MTAQLVPPPSLFQSESRGGDIAESGFSFQEQFVLSRIPIWLAQDGFTEMIREAMADTEAKFFVPSYGFQIEFIEVKNHLVTPVEFWKEIKRFQQMDRGAPADYRSFTLVSAGISESLRPLVNGLRRIRKPYHFYNDGSPIRDNSYQEYVKIVNKLQKTAQDAHFLFDKVIIRPEFGLAQSDGEALFRQSLADYLPEYEEVSSRTVGRMYASIGTLVKKRRAEPITRKELETKLRESIPSQQLPSLRPVSIHTVMADKDKQQPHSLRFNWTAFFGGNERLFPPAKEWNETLLGSLLQTRDWIIQHRSTRHIKMTGSRRLSATLAFGSVFSAVAGFLIDMNYRNKSWRTDAYPTPDTPPYPINCEVQQKEGADLVVTVGIIQDITSAVEAALDALQLSHMSRLHIKGEQPILSPEQADVAVGEIKRAITDTLSRTKSRQIHLFYAGPAHLALFLAHRLNATAPVQCYEWVGGNQYTPTCRLFS